MHGQTAEVPLFDISTLDEAQRDAGSVLTSLDTEADPLKDLEAARAEAARQHIATRGIPLPADAGWDEIGTYTAYTTSSRVAVAEGLPADTSPTELAEYFSHPTLYRIKLLGREAFRH